MPAYYCESFTDFIYGIVQKCASKKTHYIKMTEVEKFAQDVVEDPLWPRRKTLEEYEAYMKKRGYDKKSLTRLHKAWDKFSLGLRQS